MDNQEGKSNFLKIDGDNDLLLSFLNDQDMENEDQPQLDLNDDNAYKSKYDIAYLLEAIPNFIDMLPHFGFSLKLDGWGQNW